MHEWSSKEAHNRIKALAAQKQRRPPPPVQVRIKTQTQIKTEEEKQEDKKKKTKRRRKKKKQSQVLYNALFEGAGLARRIAFAIDISGSMSGERIMVVKKHLEMALRSMEGVEDAAFGIALFDSACKLTGLGDVLWATTTGNVRFCMDEVGKINAAGGNGGEAACLRACLNMNPQAVFFLGDGGWDANALIAEAQNAGGVTIHSIAFFTTGGGLKEIASITGGTYREINSMDFDADTPNPKAKVYSESESETDTDDSDTEENTGGG